MTWRCSSDNDEGLPGVPLAVSLQRVTARLGMAEPAESSRLFADWRNIVGDQIADHATPVSLVSGVLTLLVEEPRWKTQLRWLEANLIERLTAAFRPGFVERLDVKLKAAGSTEP